MRSADEEDTTLRGRFALAALLVFAVTLGVGVVLAGTRHWSDVKPLLGLALSVEAGVVLSAGRYYFPPGRRRPKKPTETRRR